MYFFITCWLSLLPTWATPLGPLKQRAMGEPNPESMALAAQVNAQYQTQATVVANPAYAAAQNLFWEQRRKRGPPTPAISSTGLATPSGQDDTAAEAAPTTTPPPQQPQISMFQPVVLEAEVAYQATALSMGVDTQDQAATNAWMATPLTTRKDVLETIRHYHTAVVRPELYNMINQVESTLLRFDDRILRNTQELSWLTTENRQEQRRASALMVLLTGFPATTTPQQRLYMVNWMLAQPEGLKKFVTERGHSAPEAALTMLNVLATDPTTPPAGQDKYSSITLLQFKSWDARKAFMDMYGGSGGTPLYLSETQSVKNAHIRASPASPQFQRKLEIPLRVVLHALNQLDTKKNQVVILWKSLTIMSPQEVRAFDDQQTACARLFYTTESGQLKGYMELDTDLFNALQTTPPEWLMTDETTIWNYAWNHVVFGIQHEMDVAEKQLFKEASAVSKGNGKGLKIGKGSRHWTGPAVFSSESAPYPVELSVTRVDQVAYVWDEYCDKFNESSKKCGDYKMATYKGRPAVPATSSATTP